MVSNRRSRARPPGRRTPFRSPKPRILVLCEGEVTEPEYLRAFKGICRNPRVEVEIAKERGVPFTLVRLAKERKHEVARDADRERDESLLYEQVWCVFDVDDHPRIGEALEMARANGIEVAVSNPCFELWLLLHLRENPGQRSREDLRRMLEDAGHPGKHVNFARFAPGYELAVSRAERLEREADAVGEAGRNPTTGVWRLTRSIQGIAEGDRI